MSREQFRHAFNTSPPLSHYFASKKVESLITAAEHQSAQSYDNIAINLLSFLLLKSS